MRNVTISLDDETARWARIEAARRDTSLSRFVGAILQEAMSQPDAYTQAHQSYLSRAAVVMGAPQQPYPARDEVHQR